MPVARKKKGTASKIKKTDGATPINKYNGDLASPNEEDEENSQLPEDSEGESDDGKEWCICKGPDDGRKMINCDGCENWFHLKCLKIADYLGDLIKDFYCPACTSDVHKTKYNPHCLLKGCMKPARPDLYPAGNWKYCSDDHGRRCMKELLKKVAKNTSPSKGGSLNRGELLTMLKHTDNVEKFQALGQKPAFDTERIRAIKEAASLSQPIVKVEDSVMDLSRNETPNTTSLNGTAMADFTYSAETLPIVNEDGVAASVEVEEDVHMRGGEGGVEVDDGVEESLFDPAQYDEQLLNEDEMTRMLEIEVEKTNAKATVELYKRKGEHINNVKERNTVIHSKIKAFDESRKVTCGFDSTFALNDPQLTAFFETLPDSKLEVPTITATMTKDGGDKVFGKWTRTDGWEDAHSICLRKKCAKHMDWLKIAKDDAKYQIFLANKQFIRLEMEEKEIRDVAQIRALVDDE